MCGVIIMSFYGGIAHHFSIVYPLSKKYCIYLQLKEGMDDYV